MKAEISKSLVAFFIALEIFVYHLLCLWGSGFAEANRILLCGGIITLLYFSATIRSWARVRTTMALSFVVAVLLGAWAIRIFGLHEYGTAGGNGLFYRDFFAGDVKYCMDCLFHSTIVESIKNYLAPSSLIGAVEGMSYHVGADWVMAGIAKILGVSGFAMIGYIYPLIFLPLVSSLSIAVMQAIKRHFRADGSFSISDAFFLLFFMLVPGFNTSLFVYFIHSETCLMGTLFLLVGIVFLPQIDLAIRNDSPTRCSLILYVLTPVLIVFAAFSKISAGYSFLALIGGLLLPHLEWRSFRKSASVCALGIIYLLLFGGLYYVTGRDTTPVMSSDYVGQLLEFCSRCFRHPVTSACLFIPMLAFFIPVSEPSGKHLRWAFFLATIASYIPYVFLRVHGGSEVYFWVNGHLLTAVYFVAIGAHRRCMKFLSRFFRWFVSLAVFLAFAYFAFPPLVSVGPTILAACSQPRPNLRVLQSTRCVELENARRFVFEKGPRNVMAYVQKDYWTALSDADRMSKAYILAVQAYLGIPVLGTVKSDSQAIYVRKGGEWTPITLPASYFLDHYLKSPIPEYSEEEAVQYARAHGYRYLLVCGADDRISVRETGESL